MLLAVNLTAYLDQLAQLLSCAGQPCFTDATRHPGLWHHVDVVRLSDVYPALAGYLSAVHRRGLSPSLSSFPLTQVLPDCR